MQVTHVLGLAHSGTTILDRILASYPGVVGLGEIEQIWKKVHQDTIGDAVHCPCGAEPRECAFWSGILSSSHATQEGFFRAVVKTAGQQGYKLLVDTSKAQVGSSYYGRMLAGGALENFVQIRLVRDPRGWVQSMMRRNEVSISDLVAIRGLFYRWLVSSINLDRRANRPGSERVYVWYDKLILGRGENELARLLGLPLPESGEITLDKANQHAIAGNKFVFSGGRSAISYDPRWLESDVIDDIYAQLPALRAYYHEVQKLHLTKGARMTQLPKIDRMKGKLMQSIAQGDFSTVEDVISDLSAVAELPSVAQLPDAA